MTDVGAVPMVPVHDPDWWTGDFWPEMARLRATDPIHRVETPAGLVWAVSRHADVLSISRDPRRWISGRGVLIDDLRRPVAGTESIIYLDPPEHVRNRQLVSSWFKPSAVARLEDRIRALARRLVADAVGAGPIEANTALAVPLPIIVIAELLGVPASDLDKFREWSDQVIEDGSSQEVGEEISPGVVELYVYFREHLRQRRADPTGDDLLTSLAIAEIDGHRLDDQEILAFCMTLLVAGNETTRNLIANGLIALAEHPGEWSRLRQGEVRPPDAVEELLRWVTPVVHFARTATEDVEMSGHRFSPGDVAVLLYPSANRDEDVFGPTAGELVLDRSPNPHLAFGFGEHFCLGARLARLEARVMLEELAQCASSMHLTGPVVRRRSNLMRALENLPMELVAA